MTLLNAVFILKKKQPQKPLRLEERVINPLLNGKSVKTIVSIFSSTAYVVIDFSANLVKSMGPLSSNGYVQMYQAGYWLNVLLNS